MKGPGQLISAQKDRTCFDYCPCCPQFPSSVEVPSVLVLIFLLFSLAFFSFSLASHRGDKKKKKRIKKKKDAIS